MQTAENEGVEVAGQRGLLGCGSPLHRHEEASLKYGVMT